MPHPRVLIFGGNGRIARSMTSLMLARSWDVISIIRNAEQKAGILQLGEKHPGTIDVLVSDLEHLKCQDDAKRILDKVRPTCVVFAAGSMSNVYAIDRDAAKKIIKASTDAPFVTKFLMISFPASRRRPAPWWDSQDIKMFNEEKSMYPDVAEAKLQADEYLVAMAKAREVRGGPAFQAISLRPSWLLTSPPTGKVQLGKTRSFGQVAIGDVAAVAVSLLSRDDATGWFDLLRGSDEIEEAVDKVIRDKINCIEGEDLDRMYRLAD
ncbi:hypothetical protein M432DRAFT_437303 [Thermoascus aurantiacus ATCC 26904]